MEVLVIGPEATPSGTNPSSNPSPSPSSPITTASSSGLLHFDAELPLRHHAGAQLPLTFSLGGGASAADCVLAAADPSAGLAAGLGLSPVLLVSGVHRGPALGAGETAGCWAGKEVGRAGAVFFETGEVGILKLREG